MPGAFSALRPSLRSIAPVMLLCWSFALHPLRFRSRHAGFLCPMLVFPSRHRKEIGVPHDPVEPGDGNDPPRFESYIALTLSTSATSTRRIDARAKSCCPALFDMVSTVGAITKPCRRFRTFDRQIANAHYVDCTGGTVGIRTQTLPLLRRMRLPVARQCRVLNQ